LGLISDIGATVYFHRSNSELSIV